MACRKAHRLCASQTPLKNARESLVLVSADSANANSEVLLFLTEVFAKYQILTEEVLKKREHGIPGAHVMQLESASREMSFTGMQLWARLVLPVAATPSQPRKLKLLLKKKKKSPQFHFLPLSESDRALEGQIEAYRLPHKTVIPNSQNSPTAVKQYFQKFRMSKPQVCAEPATLFLPFFFFQADWVLVRENEVVLDLWNLRIPLQCQNLFRPNLVEFVSAEACVFVVFLIHVTVHIVVNRHNSQY